MSAHASILCLSKPLLTSLAILNRGSQSVRSVLTSEDNRFTRALADLKRLALAENIPIAIVNGLGAIRYGYPAATQDIDIVVGRDNLDRFVVSTPQFGFKVAWPAQSGWHTLTHADVEINIVPEGGKSRATAPTSIPGPLQLGVAEGLEYANLPGWLELKLSSGRQKDRAHIVEVLKVTTDAEIQQTRAAMGRLHPTYPQLFEQLQDEACEERKQEDERR